ncbi:uncharacterized protein LOC125500960 [Athalia rosae]|uniref:uncharacterized protein LOC125500960 n=1 Tax=Athalia rosae TaxID=37344 RepID=UPI002033D995|nr:uncharacterized protein LOC125500960 [Athalia rosae]
MSPIDEIGMQCGGGIIKRHLSRGRGIPCSDLSCNACLCDRAHRHILCAVCGYTGWGRIKFSCPQHPQTIFLIDVSQCPKCRAYGYMMSEF